MIDMRSGSLHGKYLLDVSRLSELREIEIRDAELAIGAAVTITEISTSETIGCYAPALQKAADKFAGRQVRNIATIGGNLVNAVPSADGAIPLIALDASVKLYGAKGERSLALVHFFTGPGQTVLTKGEILTEIVIPRQLPRTGSAYIKFGRRKAMELPMLGVGVLLSLEANSNHCARARVCLGVAAPTPFRALGAERFLVGKEITAEALQAAGKIAAEECQVRDSIRGVAWYRREMVAVLVRRMGQRCIDRINNQEI